MAANASVSLSIQASVIVQQQTRKHPQDDHCGDPTQQQQQQGKKQQHLQQQQPLMPLWKQVMLTLALVGNEATTSFEQVYTFLSLQYIGVPVSLISLNGTIAGIGGMLLIPTVGTLVDRGPNPKRRKMLALMLGLTMLVAGFLLVITGCAMKISETVVETPREIVIENFTSHDLFLPTTYPSMNTSPTGTFESISGVNFTTSNYNNDAFSNAIPSNLFWESATDLTYSENSTSFSVISSSAFIGLPGILGIIGYSVVDMSFDLANPMVRAYVLDHTSPPEHSRLLLTATMVSAMAGTGMSLLGSLDFSSGLTEIFHVDGLAATFILLISVDLVLVIIGYFGTVVTGKMLKNEQDKGMLDTTREIPVSGGDLDLVTKDPEKNINNVSVRSSVSGYHRLRDEDVNHSQTFTNANVYEEENICKQLEKITEKTPLITQKDPAVLEPTYTTFSGNVSTFRPDLRESSASVKESAVYENSLTSDTVTLNVIPENVTNNKELEIPRPKRYRIDTENTDLSMSTATVSPLGDFHNKKLEYLNSTKAKPILGSKKLFFLNKKLIILVLATFFSVSSNICFVMYAPNALTLDIYGGDAAADVGSEENENYKKGLRSAAFASFIFYMSYMVTSIFNKKVFDVIGERVHYIVCHLLLSVCVGVLILTKTVEVYYLAFAAFGPFRTCVFTTPFLLANKFANEEGEATESNKDNKDTKAGRVMALIGATLPCTYVITSSIMGPLIDVTGNVWLPVVWSVVANVLAVFIICFLYFV